MTTFVHIGCHKTATSWFQRFVYPRMGSHRLIDRELVRSIFLDGSAFGFDLRTARDRLGLNDGHAKDAILCEEDLSGVLHQGLISGYVAREVARRLQATLPEAKIVIFVREQASASVSWYEQYVREGGTTSIHRYLFPEYYRHRGHVRPFKTPRFDFSQLDYRGLVNRYDALFGVENVIVMPYEDLVDDRLLLLRRLGDALDTQLPDGGPARPNGSYRRALLPLVRAANLFTARSVIDKSTLIHIPYWYTIRKAMFERLNRSPIFGRPPSVRTMLGDKALAWIRHRFWSSNRWLADRMHRDLGAIGYAVEPPNQEAPKPPRRLPLQWMAN